MSLQRRNLHINECCEKQAQQVGSNLSLEHVCLLELTVLFRSLERRLQTRLQKMQVCCLGDGKLRDLVWLVN